MVCELTDNKEKLLEEAEGIAFKFTDGSTSLESGLNRALDEFVLRGRPGYDKMIILVSDGDVNNPTLCINMAAIIKEAGVKVCSVLILDGSKRPDFMKEIANGCYVESDYKSLYEELRKLDVCI